MGYRISYGSSDGKVRKVANTSTISTVFGCFMILSAIVFRILEPEGSEAFRECFIPMAETVNAFIENAEDFHSVEVFCLEILQLLHAA